MIKHTVKQGECISSIAYKYGFLPDTLQQDSVNSELMQLRDDPDILLPGDVINIPDKRTKTEQVPTDQQQKFVRKGVPAYLTLQLLDDEQEPRANMDYTLTVDSITISDTTDADGYIDTSIPPNARKATLVLDIDGNTEEYEIPLGHIDPIDEVSGIQERLHNLGYDCGRIDGQLGDKTSTLIKHFQQQQGLEETGEINDATKQKLLEIHGS